jgi:hypothetical protein
LRSTPLLGRALRSLSGRTTAVPFETSWQYWESRYATGRDSGAGSEGRLAAWKAQFLNEFVSRNGIELVVELGCGDGRQLSRARYPYYFGLDVSKTAIALCTRRFKNDRTKAFRHWDWASGPLEIPSGPADLALSLDVVYHLVEDAAFEAHMNALFASSRNWVVVYSTNEESASRVPWVRHREFTAWIVKSLPGWHLVERHPNRFPFEREDGRTSSAEFFVYHKH